MAEQQQIAQLLQKHLQGSLTEAEAQLLEEWKNRAAANQRFFDALQNDEQLSSWIAEDHPDQLRQSGERLYAKVLDQLPQLRVIPLYRQPWFRVAVAACIILMVGIGSWVLFFNKPAKTEQVITAQPANDVEAPAITKATITLADGRTVAVDSLSILTQNNVQLSKTADGKIVYSGNAEKLVYNTLTNPRGSKVVDMMLGDGSRVWLNAGSSVTYPVAFIGNERKVVITGEAYFEITHDAEKPFYVSKGNMSVQVLGTKFNVNAYDDEPDVRVTLLEGSVNVAIQQAQGNNNQLLRPGQQARVANSIKVISSIDVDEVMAWKEGYFKFNRADVKTIMRQLARWYDLEISYAGEIPRREFGGEMQRDLPLSGMLRLLEKGNLHFKVEGKHLTLMN